MFSRLWFVTVVMSVVVGTGIPFDATFDANTAEAINRVRELFQAKTGTLQCTFQDINYQVTSETLAEAVHILRTADGTGGHSLATLAVQSCPFDVAGQILNAIANK